jgi:hypothetical protein
MPHLFHRHLRKVFGDMLSSQWSVVWLVQVVPAVSGPGFIRDEEDREAMWEQEHKIGAHKMYSLCFELGGLSLKVLAGFCFTDMSICSVFLLTVIHILMCAL